MIRVLVLAASPTVRAGLETMLRAHERITVVGDSVRNGDLAGAIRAHHPDVVVTDSDARRQHALADAPPIVLLSDELTRAELRRELHSGVRGVLPRDANDTELAAAVEAVVADLV